MMQLPKHKIGVHWIPVHQRTEDENYMKALRPSCIKIINPDPEQIKRCLTYIDNNGFVWLRDHPLSEQKNDQMTKPVETGIRHANEWFEKLTVGRFKNVFDPKRIIVSGINEPYVRDENEEKAALEYNKAMLNRATELGFKVAALNLSVGWPRNLGKDQPPYWEPFFELEDVINKGNHFLSVHEYWYSYPSESWFDNPKPNEPDFGWLAYRINYCPMQVPIIIGELGMEKMVDAERRKNEGNPPKGWIGNLNSRDYAKQLWDYTDKVNPNVFSVLPFTTDWGSHDWDSQDTLYAQNDIVALKHDAMWPSTYPVVPIHHAQYTGSQPNPEPQPEPDKPTGQIVKPYDFSKGHFVRGFGSTPTHGGVDIGMAEGTPLYAMADGIVAWSDVDTAANGGYGQYVRIYYPILGFDSFYGHMSKRLVENGQKVAAGDLIGYSGNTGNSTGPHLHLEFRLKNLAVDNPIHAYANYSAFGRGRTDPMAIFHFLKMQPFS